MGRYSKSEGNNSQDTASLMGDVARGQKEWCALKVHVFGAIRSFVFPREAKI